MECSASTHHGNYSRLLIASDISKDKLYDVLIDRFDIVPVDDAGRDIEAFDDVSNERGHSLIH